MHEIPNCVLEKGVRVGQWGVKENRCKMVRLPPHHRGAEGGGGGTGICVCFIIIRE